MPLRLPQPLGWHAEQRVGDSVRVLLHTLCWSNASSADLPAGLQTRARLVDVGPIGVIGKFARLLLAQLDRPHPPTHVRSASDRSSRNARKHFRTFTISPPPQSVRRFPLSSATRCGRSWCGLLDALAKTGDIGFAAHANHEVGAGDGAGLIALRAEWHEIRVWQIRLRRLLA